MFYSTDIQKALLAAKAIELGLPNPFGEKPVEKKIERTLLVNLFGGPGTGKSTTMAGVFAELKLRGVNCEMAPEYAKDKVWEESYRVLDNQIYVFAKQLHTIRRLIGKVDVILTDSPLLLSLHYAKNESDTFKRLVVETHHNLTVSLNIFLEREKDYNPAGRLQTYEEAREIDEILLEILKNNFVGYHKYPARREVIIPIAELIETRLNCRC